MGRKSLVQDVTSGICGSVIDLLIWQIALVGASFGKYSSRGVYQAFREADEFLQEINHHTLASSWHKLTKKRLIIYAKRDNLYSPQITEFGKKRLASIFPKFFVKRPWDKRIYLITYDVPETAHKKRDKLRYFLRQIGSKLLQESTWLTPYNPREMLNDFVKENRIPGAIIISDIGTDGGVGETSIQDLLMKLYGLEKLNERYEEFMKDVKRGNKQLRYLLFQYLAILRDDPQLPFELLSRGWRGDKAYSIYKTLETKYILSFPRPSSK